MIPNAIMLGEVSRMLAEGRIVTISTKGNSMMPFIVGDRDSVELVRRDSYEPGEIVLAQIGKGHWVLHRLVAKEGEIAILHGDGNLTGNEKCRMSDIAGSVDRIICPGRDIDCRSERFARRSVIWNSQPYIIKRLFLAIFRRII